MIVAETRNKKQETRNKKQETRTIMTCFLLVKGSVFEKETKVATTILSRDYKGLGNYRGNAVIIRQL